MEMGVPEYMAKSESGVVSKHTEEPPAARDVDIWK